MININKISIITLCLAVLNMLRCPQAFCYEEGAFPAGYQAQVYVSQDGSPWQPVVNMWSDRGMFIHRMFAVYDQNGPLPPGHQLPAYAVITPAMRMPIQMPVPVPRPQPQRHHIHVVFRESLNGDIIEELTSQFAYGFATGTRVEEIFKAIVAAVNDYLPGQMKDVFSGQGTALINKAEDLDIQGSLLDLRIYKVRDDLALVRILNYLEFQSGIVHSGIGCLKEFDYFQEYEVENLEKNKCVFHGHLLSFPENVRIQPNIASLQALPEPSDRILLDQFQVNEENLGELLQNHDVWFECLTPQNDVGGFMSVGIPGPSTPGQVLASLKMIQHFCRFDHKSVGNKVLERWFYYNCERISIQRKGEHGTTGSVTITLDNGYVVEFESFLEVGVPPVFPNEYTRFKHYLTCVRHNHNLARNDFNGTVGTGFAGMLVKKGEQSLWVSFYGTCDEAHERCGCVMDISRITNKDEGIQTLRANLFYILLTEVLPRM